MNKLELKKMINEELLSILSEKSYAEPIYTQIGAFTFAFKSLENIVKLFPNIILKAEGHGVGLDDKRLNITKNKNTFASWLKDNVKNICKGIAISESQEDINKILNLMNQKIDLYRSLNMLNLSDTYLENTMETLTKLTTEFINNKLRVLNTNYTGPVQYVDKNGELQTKKYVNTKLSDIMTYDATLPMKPFKPMNGKELVEKALINKIQNLLNQLDKLSF